MPVRSLNSSVFKWPDRTTVDGAVRAWAMDAAQRHPELVRAGYFGSYARGDWGVGSDLDLVVVVGTGAEQFERRALAWDLGDLPVPAELLVYTHEEWQQLQAQGGRFAQTLAGETVWVYPPTTGTVQGMRMQSAPIECTPEKREAVLVTLREALEAQRAVVFAYVHGSFLDAQPFHDIDVGVYLEAMDAQRMGPFAHELALDLEACLSQKHGQRLPLDVRALNLAPLGFRYHVFRGRLLFSQDEALRLQEVQRTVSCYLDLKPLRRQALKEALMA